MPRVAIDHTHTGSGRATLAGRGPAGIPSTGVRLSSAYLLYLLVIVLVITLSPFRFEVGGPVEIIVWELERFDLIANVLLFLPLGFLAPLVLQARRPLLFALAGGLLFSTGIEVVQLFLPARYTSLLDVAANTTGAVLGAVCQQALSARLRGNTALIGRLSLELPLMGALYLLIPVLWLASLAVDEPSMRLVGVGALGLTGARMIAVLQQQHFGPAAMLSARGAGLLAAGWTMLGVFPLARLHPGPAALIVILCAVVAATDRPPERLREDRRFEALALRRALPCVSLYLVASAALPFLTEMAEWQFWIGFSGGSRSLSTLEQLRFLESIAATTFIGYLLAEVRGRRELPLQLDLPVLLLAGALIALVQEGSRGLMPGLGASLAQSILVMGSTGVGGWIYHAQRAHVRALLAGGAPAPLPGG